MNAIGNHRVKKRSRGVEDFAPILYTMAQNKSKTFTSFSGGRAYFLLQRSKTLDSPSGKPKLDVRICHRTEEARNTEADAARLAQCLRGQMFGDRSIKVGTGTWYRYW